MATIFISDVSEFASLRAGAVKAGYRVKPPRKGYWQIDADNDILLNRKALGLRVALWNCALAGGFLGKILRYDRYTIRIINES